MTTTACVHDMPPGTCSWCTGRDGGETAARERDRDLIRRHRAFTADYPGKCGGCGEPFPAGAAISGRAGRWRASCCIDDNGSPVR